MGKEALAAQKVCQLEGLHPGGLPHGGDVDVAGVQGREVAALRHHGGKKPLQPHGEADALGGVPPQLLDEAAIPAAAAADQPLPAGGGVDHLKDGAGVVVQPPDDGGLHPEGDLRRGKAVLDLLEVVLAVLAEVVQDAGGPGGNFLVLRVLAVQHPQGVLLQPLQAGGAKALPVAFKIGQQGLGVFLAALRAA